MKDQLTMPEPATQPRISYASHDTLAPRDQPLFDRLEALRGKPVENIFLALATVPSLCEGVLGMATALRSSTLLDRQLRELAVLVVGLETASDYEVAHHWNAAVKGGIPREKLDCLAEFETSAQFTPHDRAVMRFARAATRSGRIDDPLWDELRGFLDDGERLELVLTVAWYNCVVRILLPLNIQIEDWYQRL